MKSVGFIGLGNVGGKLAGSLLRNKCQLMVRDLDKTVAQPFIDASASWADSPKIMAEKCDIIITCLPSPAASAAVMEADDGILAGLSDGKIWAEMSTTDAAEVTRLGALVKERGADPVDCPVSGGCHRAATGNIAIFAGCDRPVFEKILPLLTILCRRVLHTGALGSREWSPNIIKRLEEACGVDILAPGFPAEMSDDEVEEAGYEIIPKA